MNFVLKGILRRAFQQYLDLQQPLNIDSGAIKLAEGHLNKQKFNKKLSDVCAIIKVPPFQIIDSKFHNLHITLPILQLMTKPIRVQIKSFDLFIQQQTVQGEVPQQTKINLGQVVQQQLNDIVEQQDRKKEEKHNEKQSQPSTLKNLVNRLLFNMQIIIQHVNITLRTHSKKFFNTEFHFFLKNLHIRNSSIQIDGMNVKKTINMRKLQVGCQALGQALIQDFNICLDYNQKCIEVIALMDNLEILVFNINSILDLANKIIKPEKIKRNKRRVSISSQRDTIKPLSPNKQQSPSQYQLNLYFKMNNFTFALEDLIQARIKIFQIRAEKISRQKSLEMNLKELVLLNNRKQNVQQVNKILLKVSYQPPNPIFKTSYQHEKNMLKHCQLYVQLTEQPQSEYNKKLYNISAMLYYLSIEVDYNIISNAIKDFFATNKDIIEKVNFLLLKLKNPQQNNQEKLVMNQINQHQIMKPKNSQNGFGLNKLQIVLYRAALSVKMPNHLKFQLILSTVLNSTDKIRIHCIHIMQLAILLHHEKYSKIKKLKVLEIANTHIKHDDLQNKGQIVISGQSIVSQITIQMVPWIKILLKTVGNDVQQMKKIYQGIIQNIQKMTLKQYGHNIQKDEMIEKIKLPLRPSKKSPIIKIQKALFKMPAIIIKVGSCQLVKIADEAKKPMNFKHLIELEIDNLSGYYTEKKSKLKLQIALYIFSPHTLQKGTIINELKFESILKKNNNFNEQSNYDLELSFKNNLIINLEEIFLRTIFEYLQCLKCKEDHNSVFLSAMNLTKQSIVFKQNTLSFIIDPGHVQSIFVEPSKQMYPSATIQTLSKVIDQSLYKEKSSQQLIDFQQKTKRVNSKRSSFSIQEKLANYNFQVSTTKGISQKISIFNPSTQFSIMEQNVCFDYEFEDNQLVVMWVPKFGLVFKQRIMIAAFTGKLEPIQIGWKSQTNQNQQQKSLLSDTQDKINLVSAENMKDILYFDKIFQLKKHFVGANTLDELSENYKSFLIKINKSYYEFDNPILNDKYSLYPLTKFQQPENQQKIQLKQETVEQIKTSQKPTKQTNLYDYYVYQQKNLNSVYLQILPFLIVQNNLENSLKLSIQNRKNQKTQNYSFQRNEARPLISTQNFDYFMKQFTFVLSVTIPTIRDGVQKQQQFKSQEHYFNTFFMVTDHFETVIQLRSISSPVKKIYYTVSQRIQAKTKILSFFETLRIVNNSSVSLGIQYHGRSGSGEDRGPLWVDSKKYINHGGMIIKNYGTLSFLYENRLQTKVDVKCQWLIPQNQSVVLSFNFCKQGEKYYHALLGLRLQTRLSVQVLIIEDFIECTNLCTHQFQINNNKVYVDHTIPLFLPSTVDHRFNNKSFPIHGPEIQQLFKQLFLSDNNKISGQSLSIRFHQQNKAIPFVSLLLQSIHETINSQNISEFTVYTLFKDFKSKINFFITQSLYDSNSFYTLCNNQTNHHFLFTQDYQCGHYLIKGQEEELQSPKSNGSRQNRQQKILLKPRTSSQFINKQNYDLFHCDNKRSHLRKIDKKLMQDLGIKFQTHYLQQFTVVNIEEANKPKLQIQFITKAITVKFRTKLGKSQSDTQQNLRRVIMINLNRLTFRLLQQNKMDLLLCDLTISQQSLNETILKIPQESYLLIELKQINNKFCMIKNMFLKCKNTIININEKLLAALLNFYKAISGEIIADISNKPKKVSQRKINEQIVNLIQQSMKKQFSTSKFMEFLSQTIFLMKNLYIHQIHLSLTLNLQNISFSNALTLPSFQLSNKPFRVKKIKKEIADFYLGNLLAKFPKLSFCMQGLKHPINMIKTILNVRGALKDKVFISKICDYGSSIVRQQSLRPLSLQALNMYILNSCNQPSHRFPNIIVSSIQFDRKLYLLSLQNLIVVSNQLQIETILALRDLEKIKIIKSKGHSEIMLRFRNTSRNNSQKYLLQNNYVINFYTVNKKGERLVNWLNDLIL